MIRANELDKNAVDQVIEDTVKEWLEIAEREIIRANKIGKNEFINWDHELSYPKGLGYFKRCELWDKFAAEMAEYGYTCESSWVCASGYGHIRISW